MLTAQKTAGPATAENSITWVFTLGEGMTLAQSSKKPLMVDFYAGIGAAGARNSIKMFTLTREVVALSKEFVCVKVDTDKYGADASKYGVQGLPTIAFLNADGTVIDKIVGYNPAPDFAASMKKALKK